MGVPPLTYWLNSMRYLPLLDHSTHWVLLAVFVKAGSPVPLTMTSAEAVPTSAPMPTQVMATMRRTEFMTGSLRPVLSRVVGSDDDSGSSGRRTPCQLFGGGVPVVQAQRVAGRVLEERLVADAGVDDVGVELNALGLQLLPSGGHVVDLQRDGER